jgi:hypothetical protein
LEKYPANGEQVAGDRDNTAIRLYGRRLYKDQTPVEYLAEFLLAFASPKGAGRDGTSTMTPPNCFVVPDGHKPHYYPKNHVALKLFSFFPSSKLETRHQAHRDEYLAALKKASALVLGTEQQKEETVRLLQSLFAGFVGVAKNRTWVTYAFLPASSSLLAREVNWEHGQARKEPRGAITDWESSLQFFDDTSANFMARGGEVLFLQLVNLFTNPPTEELASHIASPTYRHIELPVKQIGSQLEQHLATALTGSLRQIDKLAELIEDALSDYRLRGDDQRPSYLAWVPRVTQTEALLFAWEMNNICTMDLGTLDRLELLQRLCCMQVLRSLCFQAKRIDDDEADTPGFAGNYVWIASDPDSPSGESQRQLAQQSFKRIDDLLFRAVRHRSLYEGDTAPEYKNADDNAYRFFRKMAKDIGFLIPKTGNGQRFAMDQSMVRFLVAALVPRGHRIRLNEFYRRIFAHYGLALGGAPLKTACAWLSRESESDYFASTSATKCFEETLKQGGFLVELSDAVSIVTNEMA